jgi:hypothetical protein
VTALDGADARAIRAATGDFVDRCWTARTWNSQAAEDQKRLDRLFGNPETGGWSLVTPDPTPRRVLRAQGEVWQELQRQLSAQGIEMRKPRHARRYEVDAEILASSGPLLLEIKTGTTPTDVYGGVGQLALYPLLLPDLARHRRVLLLPGSPKPDLVEALKGCNVELHSFALQRRGRRVEVNFSAQFLRLCGVAIHRPI